ncbi:MAG: cupin domain-containing protein [Planctomycetota bacterium]|nr:cupin domain-containing protein [Planctomycetota bacterium]
MAFEETGANLIMDERIGNPLPPTLAAKQNPSAEAASQDSFFDRLEKLIASDHGWDEFLSREKLYCGIYHLAAGSDDGQSPHDEDEVYYVVGGASKFTSGEKEMTVKAGDVLFVPALEAHRFHDISEDLKLLVFFVRNQKG